MGISKNFQFNCFHFNCFVQAFLNSVIFESAKYKKEIFEKPKFRENVKIYANNKLIKRCIQAVELKRKQKRTPTMKTNS
jgi:hypothetical protein